MKFLPNKKFLDDVMDLYIFDVRIKMKIGLFEDEEETNYMLINSSNGIIHGEFEYNIYELVHSELKKWAKQNNFFNAIDWSEEPENIFKKAEELWAKDKYESN